MDRIGADFDNVVDMMRDRLKANAHPVQYPMGAGEASGGSWTSSGCGPSSTTTTWAPSSTRRTSPRTSTGALRAPRGARRGRRRLRRRPHGEVPGGRGAHRGRDPQRRPEGHHLRGRLPGLLRVAFKNKGVQALLDGVIDFLPSPLDVPAIKGRAWTTRRTGAPGAAGRRQGALRGPGVQDHDRPVRGEAHLLPRLLRVHPLGHPRPQRDRRGRRSGSAVSCRCTPTSGTSGTRSTPATSPPPSG
jgi:hypothetical protein